MNFHQKCCLLLTTSFLILLVACSSLKAQQQECVFTAPLITIDFGNSNVSQDINLNALKKYTQIDNSCPNDGHYTFATSLSDCFGGNWHPLTEDHTPNDINGKMMIVNASEEPGSFFMLNIAGLKAGGTYQFATWIVNICKSAYGCTPTPPLIKVSILSDGKILNSFNSGTINPSTLPQWKKYSAPFTLPANVNKITLQMEDMTKGGCGNDFALDDITLQECNLPLPVIEKTQVSTRQQTDKKIITKKIPSPVIKKDIVIPAAKTEVKEVPTLKKNIPAENPVPIKTERKKGLNNIVSPAPITTRANPVIKEIKTTAGNLLIELYDNGQIDGDTISIYHNNQLIISKAGLSAKPLQFNLTLNEQQRHHEIIMVADNLGSIPPNTSLMIITAKNKRYEIFISSTEQKNAKIVIDLNQ